MTSDQAVRYIEYALLFFVLGFFCSLLLPLPWYVIPLSAFPITVVSIWLVIKHRRFIGKYDSAGALYLGSSLFLLSISLMGLFASGNVPPPLSAIALFVAIGGIGLLSAITLLLNGLIYYYNRVQVWHRRGAIGIHQLGKLLQEGNVLVRRHQAAKLLGQIGDSHCIELLINALDDEDSRVRAEAARALAGMGEARALPRLLDMTVHDAGFDAKGLSVKDIAAEAIARFKNSKPDTRN